MRIVPLSPEEGGDTEEAGERVEPETLPSSYPYTWAMLLARIYEALPPVSPSRAPPEEEFDLDQRVDWDDDTEV